MQHKDHRQLDLLGGLQHPHQAQILHVLGSCRDIHPSYYCDRDEALRRMSELVHSRAGADAELPDVLADRYC